MPTAAVVLVNQIVSILSTSDWPVRWVSPETAHLTLHFLGDVAPERAQLLRMALTPALAQQSAFTIQTGHLGVFPDLQRPRVIWLGLDGQTNYLSALHAAVAAALRTLEFPVETRDLRAHLTLGRVRDNPSSGFPVNLRRRMNDPELRTLVEESSMRFPVTEVQLIRSYLGKTGARHETLARYPLLPYSPHSDQET